MQTDFDIIIIGAGPAGCTLARLLADKYKIAVIDPKSDNDDSFKKPCGGLLSEDAQKALARFDLTLPKSVIVDPQIFAVRTIDLKNDLIRHYQRFYVNLDRHRFDLWLRGLIPQNADIMTAKAREIKAVEGGFAVSCEEKTVTAKYVVGADGAGSLVRRSFFPKRKIRSYTAIQQWFRESSPNPFYSCIFDPETSDCCSWSISKDDHFIFGGAFPHKNCRERFERQKEKLSEKWGFKFGEPVKTEACLVYRPKKMSDFVCGKDGVLLIGEAAGFISPSSLEGFSFAINSALLLAECFLKGDKGVERRYSQAAFSLKLRLMGKVLKCPFMYWSFLRKIVMKSGVSALKIVD